MPRKKKEEVIKEEIKIEEPKKLDVSIIYHEGDNIEEIAKTLTGHAYLAYRLLEVNGYNMRTLKDGAILTWEI